MRSSFFCTLIIVLLSAFFVNAEVVETEYGYVNGIFTDGVHEFLGVPFAAPPVDSLRWRAPRSPSVWKDTLLANTFCERCIQKDYGTGDNSTEVNVIGSEDCLYLNVWTPSISTSTQLPVMVFIHGGGNQQGNANDSGLGTSIYNGYNLSLRGNVVVVTIQYRLGVMGFLVNEALEGYDGRSLSGNYGVLDQIHALKWVRKNISVFGGDTNRILVFGESAGGLNTGNLLVSPLAEGLFNRAAIQSAIPQLSAYDTALVKSREFIDSVVKTGSYAEKISQMRSMDAESIVVHEKDNVVGGVVMGNWRPVVDGFVFNDLPLNIFNSGDFNNMPLLVGSNADEMSIGAPKTVTPLMVTALIRTKIPEPFRLWAEELYPAGNSNEEAKQSYVQILTDGQFTSTTRRVARAIEANQEEPVWRYFFSHTHSQLLLKPLGAYHGLELFFVFNNYENSPYAQGNAFTEADDSVQRNMLNYWVNFAKTGNPNDNELSVWPAFSAGTDCYLEIKALPDGTQCGLRTVKCDLWDSVWTYMNGLTGTECGAKTSLSGQFDCVVKPNPFNPVTTINLIRNADNTSAIIIDMNGKLITCMDNIPVNGTIQWDASIYPSGVYLLEVLSSKMKITRKLILLK